jgi:phosphatidylglycerophosphate synthase
MLDQYIRPLIDPPLHVIGKFFVKFQISANIMTFIGFVIGLIACAMIIMHQFILAAMFICLNRIADGLDGAIARHYGASDFGGFLDIVCDFIIYAGIVFAFGIATENLFYASFLIFSFIGPITSFLGYAIIATKRKINSTRSGKKSFYYLGGICEGTETAFVLILFCIIPEYFNAICLIYGILCWVTTLGRSYKTWVDFGRMS